MKTKKLTLCFLVLGIMLVSIGMISAAHTSTATISPSGWLKPNTATNFSVSVTKVSGTDIIYVKIQKPSTFSGISCGTAPTGWSLILNDTTYCKYGADDINAYITTGNSKTFTLQATTSTDYGNKSWTITTTDIGDAFLAQNINSIVQTIQNAIDTAADGSTINIPAGTYVESVNVTKDVTINGTGKDSTIITPGAGNYGFKITSNGVTISNLQIQTQFVLNDADDTGIMVVDVDNVEISNNKIISTSGTDVDGKEGSLGIWICGTDSGCSSSDNLVIKQNIITINGVSTGIYAEQVNAKHSGWQITSNNITANEGELAELYDVSNSEVSGNTLDGSTSYSSNFVWGSQRANITNLVFQNNTLKDSSGSMIAFLADFNNLGDTANTNVTSVTITGNTFSDWGTSTKALRIGARVTGVAVHQNKFLRGSQALTLVNEDTSSVNAENNWWETANKNTIASLISGTVDYTPWWYDATGSASDTTKPVISFENTPYSNELGKTTTIRVVISDDSGIDNYEIDWSDGATEDIASEEIGNTLINKTFTNTYDEAIKWTVTVTANDSVGNVKVATTEVTIYEKPDWVINLISGQSNFVSIPFSPKDDDADGDVNYKDVLEKVRPNLDRVWAYTYYETTGKNRWVYRKTIQNGSWSSATGQYLNDIVPGYGYIIFVKNDSVLYGNARTISGNSGDEPVIPASVKLANEYNLIGVFGNVPKVIPNALASLTSLTNGTYWHKVLDKNEAEVTGNLEPNKAYWISMKHLPDTATQDYYTYYP